MTDHALLLIALVAVTVVVVMLALSDERIVADEETEEPAAPGFKQSEHYKATWARVRDYIDGWKHVNNGR
jgi:hypothetical protein